MKYIFSLSLLLIGFAVHGQNSDKNGVPDYKDCEFMPVLLKSAMNNFNEYNGGEITENKPSFSDRPHSLKYSIPHTEETFLDFKSKNWDCEIKYLFKTEAEMVARREQFEKSLDACLTNYIKEKDGKKTHYKHKDFPGSTSYAHNLKNPMIWSFSGGSKSYWYFNITIKAPSMFYLAKTDLGVGKHDFKHENGFAVMWISEEDSAVSGIYYEGFPEERQILGRNNNGKYIYDWDGTDYDLSFTGDSMWLTIDHPEYGVLVDRAYHITTLKEKDNERNFVRGYNTAGSDGYKIARYRGDTITVNRFRLGRFYGKWDGKRVIMNSELGSSYDLYYAIVGNELWVNRKRDWLNPSVFVIDEE